MRKLVLVPLLILALTSFAGWEMKFCDSVDAQGNCTGSSEAINFSQKQQVKVLLSNAKGLQTGKVFFEICSFDPNTFVEEVISTEEVKTETASTFTLLTVTFTKAGHYLIKARDSYKDYITSREVEVK